MKALIYSLFIILVFIACSDESDNRQPRNFKMGFTTWPYDFSSEAVDDTYSFIGAHADIYAEHIDGKIPWNAFLNGASLPNAFVDEINGKASKRISSHQLLLSVSVLNSLRNDLKEDYENNIPIYESLSDEHLVNAYSAYLKYLIKKFSPNYLVMTMESNELLQTDPEKWSEYKEFGDKVRAIIKSEYPQILLAESFTLHNWHQQPEQITEEIRLYSLKSDFLAISFYPFILQKFSKDELQETFDFLHSQTSKPIAFVETGALAEDLSIPNLDIFIPSSESLQNDYLEVLLENAEEQNYEFVIWWTHRDYDRLLDFFEDDLKDLGSIWRDTGLLDENGRKRPAFSTWESSFNKK